MKKIQYIFLLLVLPFIGCSDLEEEPISILSPNGFFKSVEDVQTTINGSFGNMAEEAFWGRKFSLPLLLRSDMVGIGDQGTAGRRKDHDNFSVADDNGMITAFWPRSYQIIAGANEAILGGKSLDLNDDKINPVIAQAHFIRAYTYFHLVRLFGDIPYFTTPIIDIAASTNVSKMSRDEVYNNIISDLTFAKQWLPDTQSSSGLPTKATASGYLALVHLTLNNFRESYNEAKFIIDNEGRFELE